VAAKAGPGGLDLDADAGGGLGGQNSLRRCAEERPGLGEAKAECFGPPATPGKWRGTAAKVRLEVKWGEGLSLGDEMPEGGFWGAEGVCFFFRIFSECWIASGKRPGMVLAFADFGCEQPCNLDRRRNKI